MTIIEKLKELGFSTVSEDFYQKVEDWKSWYVGDVKGFTHYKVKTGEKTVNCKRYSLGMAKKVCEDWAGLLMNEKVSITLAGESEQAFVDEIFERNNFHVKANELQELKAALGTVAYVPRVVGQSEGGSAKEIQLDYVTVENIYPLRWRNGEIAECAFTSITNVGENQYLYLQIHRLGENGNYIIQNRLYEVKNEQVTETDMNSVKGFERIPSEVDTKSSKRQFVIDRLAIVNNVDWSIPLGISVYANAVDILKGVDVAYDSYVNEFVLGKKRIMVKPAATTYLEGEPVFDTDELVFYVLPEDRSDADTIVPIDMDLRTEEHSTGMQDQLNMLSTKCGFGEMYYRFDRGSVATATQIISENSTLFRTLKKHEWILKSVIEELCRVILRLGKSAMGRDMDENVEITVDFDDSIIEDDETEFNRDSRMLQMGVMNDWEFRMKWMNEDEKTAKEALPRMESLVVDE